jgi:hypothetical protein
MHLDALCIHSPDSLVEVPVRHIEGRANRTLYEHRRIRHRKIDIEPGGGAVFCEVIKEWSREIVRMNVDGTPARSALWIDGRACSNTNKRAAVQHL